MDVKASFYMYLKCWCPWKFRERSVYMFLFRILSVYYKMNIRNFHQICCCGFPLPQDVVAVVFGQASASRTSEELLVARCLFSLAGVASLAHCGFISSACDAMLVPHEQQEQEWKEQQQRNVESKQLCLATRPPAVSINLVGKIF
jgi:hypothetical protein